ncbi:MAG: YsnF/AvaK domain-containing protein, partial [Thermomicrobiales bacterium]
LSNDTSSQPHIGMSYDDERAAGIDTTAVPEEDLGERGHDHNHPENRVEREQPFAHYADHPQSHIDDTGSDTIRVPLTEEELTVTRRPVDRGAVRVEKDVVEEDRSLDVPVTEEEVYVARRRVDRDVEPGETAFEGGAVEVPVRGEEVDVQKRARVTEEVDVAKKPVERTQHVTGTVRREEAHVEDASGPVTDDDLNTANAVDDGTRRQPGH